MDSQLLYASVTSAAAAGGGAVVGYFIGKLTSQYTELETSFSLDPAGNDCQASDPTPLIIQKEAQVTWHVTNNCTVPISVSLRNFRRHNPSGPLGPDINGSVSPYPPTISVPAQSVADLTAVISKTHGSPGHFFYKYEIWTQVPNQNFRLNRDPEIEMYDKN